MYTDNQTRAIDKAQEILLSAERVFNRSFTIPPITFNLRGKSAGQYIYNLSTNRGAIRLNNVLLTENGERFINRTVPHEIAHHITRTIYGKVKSHGYEWRMIMKKLGFNPSRCHSFDVSNSAIKRNTTRYIHVCDSCGREHELTIYKHNRALLYRCRCDGRGNIIYTGRII